MASSSSIRTNVRSKSFPHAIAADLLPQILDGVVQHEHVSPAVQIRILEIVDDTGSASIGDIADGMPEHSNVPGAVLALVAAGVLTLGLKDGLLDANAIVRRATDTGPENDPVPSGAALSIPTTSSAPVADISQSRDRDTTITSYPIFGFNPTVLIGDGSARRRFGRHDQLQATGAYILLSDNHYYVGFGSNVGQRIGQGNQPIGDVRTIVAIADASGALTQDDAKALERVLWSRLAMSTLKPRNNEPPEGPALDVKRYSQIDSLAAQICLMLQYDGQIFGCLSPRQILAGPLTEPGGRAPRRGRDDLPRGEILEMRFRGLTALAAKQADKWILLRGSDVRIATAPSADRSIRFKRTAFLHAGLLALSPDGKSYTLQQDVVFPSGSAIAQFCTGSKGRPLSAWTPIDPDGGFDPDTPALIAA